jgi:predicted nucleotidyltransferase
MNKELYQKLLAEKRIPASTVMLGYMGSHSHGTFIPSTDANSIDDVDLMGICVGPLESYLGLGNFEQMIHKEAEWDIIVYEIRKFTRLLLLQNPNVLGLLWLKDDLYVHNDIQREYIEKREIFSSKLAYKSFIGYAYSQRKKMNMKKFEGYMGAKRKALVEKYGYDIKNAAHTIRILRMGIEFLNTSKLNVFREDAAELIDIKTGKWELDKVISLADKLLKDAELALKSSKLPDRPNTKEAELLLMNVIKERLLK